MHYFDNATPTVEGIIPSTPNAKEEMPDPLYKYWVQVWVRCIVQEIQKTKPFQVMSSYC